jgi:hypothetical protein
MNLFRQDGRWRWRRVQATTTHGNLEEELEPNLDKVIDNIQVKPIELVVFITKPKQHVIATTKVSQPIKHVVEHVHVENM